MVCKGPGAKPIEHAQIYSGMYAGPPRDPSHLDQDGFWGGVGWAGGRRGDGSEPGLAPGKDSLSCCPVSFQFHYGL